MDLKPNMFTSTALSLALTDKIQKKRSPYAFCISNLGNGPTLFYRNHRSRMKVFLVDLRQGKKSFYLDNQSKPPYIIMIAQDNQGQPADLVLYHESPNPLLEYSAGNRPLAGQIIAYGMSCDGSQHALVHTLYSPTHSNVFVTVDREFSCSTAIVDHPDLCKHLLLCGQSIFYFMNLLQEKQKEEKGGQVL